MCSVDFDTSAEFMHERVYKARKQRRCTACFASIVVGEYYLSHFSVSDGASFSESLCCACWVAREAFEKAHGVWFVPSALVDVLRDCIGSNDDPADEWRPVLADVLTRRRKGRHGEK